MTTIPQTVALLNLRGSDVEFVRNESLVPCPCRTPEGFRDIRWHVANPDAPWCDANGMLFDPAGITNVIVKAFVQPIQSTRATRLTSETLEALFGEIQADDHLGIFPESWSGTTLDFYNWGRSGEDYIVYNGRRFTVINANMIPDPSDGNPKHHWEVGLRLINDAPLEPGL